MQIDTKKEIPFMVKVLGNKLHVDAKARGKELYWEEKPPEKRAIDIEIPKYEPQTVSECDRVTLVVRGTMAEDRISESIYEDQESRLTYT